MLTARGWWFLIVAGLLAVVGVLPLAGSAPTVAVLGVTLVVWFAAEWVLFAARYRDAATRLTVERTLSQAGRTVSTAWARVACQVRVTVSTQGRYRLPVVFVTDRPPADPPPIGATHAVGELAADAPIHLRYELKPTAPGVLRFEGVAVRVADRCGFFYRRLFVRSRAEFLVLPPLVDDEGRQRAYKRFNALPPPGAHRLKRPGGGSELLDLRDYRPGDPPKMIAWKPSARRDKLITKEYESDVPVRCVLFLDSSQTVREGPAGKTPLVRLAYVAAAVAQAAAGSRDLVGLTVFDETAATALAPARTPAHTVRMLGTLAETAALHPDRRPGSADELIRYAHPLAEELYPDRLETDLNARPFGLYWLPLLDTRYGWLVILLFLFPLLLLKREVLDLVAQAANAISGRGGVVVSLLVLTAVPPLLAGGIWLAHGLRGFMPPRSTHTRKRKQLAALFASEDADNPAAVERYLKDDEAFAGRAAAFLADHHVRLPATGVPGPAAGAAKAEVFARQLTRAVLLARDNEVYVVLIDPTDLGDDPEPLLKAIRLARSRHHQVVVVVPWPDGVPFPTEPGRGGKVVAVPVPTERRGRVHLGNLIQAGLVHGYQRRFAAFRTRMARVGATVIRVEDGDPVRVVLSRLERVRVGGRR